MGVSDAPIVRKRSQKLGFTVNKGDISINLHLENPECILGQVLRAKVDSSTDGQVLIQQNRRTIASVQSGESFEIPTAELGAGETTLQAIVVLPENQTIKGEPVSISLAAPTLQLDETKALVVSLAQSQILQSLPIPVFNSAEAGWESRHQFILNLLSDPKTCRIVR